MVTRISFSCCSCFHSTNEERMPDNLKLRVSNSYGQRILSFMMSRKHWLQLETRWPEWYSPFWNPEYHTDSDCYSGMVQMSAVRVQEIELLLLDRLCSRPSFIKLVHKPVRKIGARRYSVISDAEDKLISEWKPSSAFTIEIPHLDMLSECFLPWV